MDNCKEKIDLGHYWDLKSKESQLVVGEPVVILQPLLRIWKQDYQEQIQLAVRVGL